MRVHAVGRRPLTRLVLCVALVVLLALLFSGSLAWCLTEAASLLALNRPLRLAAAPPAGRRTGRGGSPLGKEQRPVARHAVDRGWVRQRTWALPADLRRLW